MTLYKWLTSEMTSHRDKQFRWWPEGTHEATEFDDESMGAKGRGLHLLKRPVDALRFGHWPGHLFEAEAVDPIAEDDFKVRCSKVRLIQEVNRARVFGPQGDRFTKFLSWLADIPWLEGEEPIEAAIDAAVEYQARLSSWGWRMLPVETVRFEEWIAGANYYANAVNPSALTGAWTAWAETGVDWYHWVAPWAASISWGGGWSSLEAGAGAAAWAVAKKEWKGASPWPAPNDDYWKETANRVRLATRMIAGSAANDTARAAEYIICSDSLPINPYEPLMLVWMLGYWPMGVIDGKYMIGDISAVVGGDNAVHKQNRNPELLFRQYGNWTA